MIRVALAALTIAVGTPATALARDLEGYHDQSDRIGCVMVKSASNTTSVRCGAKGRSRGLVLPAAGRPREVAWAWRTDRPEIDWFTAQYRTTYYLYGGTAKLEGDSKTLRCRFTKTPSVRVRCFNGDGHSIEVTSTKLRRG